MSASRPYITSLKNLLFASLERRGSSTRECELSWLVLFDLVKRADIASITREKTVSLLRDQVLPPTSVAGHIATDHEWNLALVRVEDFLKSNAVNDAEILLQGYVLALRVKGCSASTIKNYLSDIRQIVAFASGAAVQSIFTETRLLEFARGQERVGLAGNTIRRKLTTAAQFAKWLAEQEALEPSVAQKLGNLAISYGQTGELKSGATLTSLPQIPEALVHIPAQADSGQLKLDVNQAHNLVIDPNPITSNESRKATGVGQDYGMTNPAPTSPQEKAKSRLSSKAELESNEELHEVIDAVVDKRLNNTPSHQKPRLSFQTAFTSLALVLSTLGFGLFAKAQFIDNAESPLAYPAALTRPSRTLSFQGRLTDNATNPVTVPTDMAYRLYDTGPGIGGTQLWSSGSCSVTPDQDGIFSVGLGDECGAEISGDVFSENNAVWLEVEIESETLSPRQSIKAVAYALNAETLQGYPATASAVESTVVVMDENGRIILGNSLPVIRATSPAGLNVDGQILNFTTTTGSNGNVVIDPDGLGQTYIQSNLQTAGAATIGGNLTTMANLMAAGDLNVDGDSILSGDVVISGYATVSSSLAVGYGDVQSGPGHLAVRYNVGIGTYNPSEALEVAGNVRYSGALMPGGLAGTNGFILTSAGGGTNTWSDPSTLVGALTYWQRNSGALSSKAITDDVLVGHTATASAIVRLPGTTNQDAWFNLGTGNLGVGSTTPGTKLDVVGTGRFSQTLTASNGLTLTTGALSLTATSGTLSLAGMSASSMNFGANNLTVTAGNFNTTATGINGTAIGATTPSTGAFTTLSANSTVTLSGLAAGTDNSVLVLNGSNQVVTDEIDPRVWGTGLVDGTSTAGYVTFWSDTDTISGESQLNVTRGGLGADMTAVGAGELIYSSATNAYDTLAAGPSGYILQSNGAAAPSWISQTTISYWQRNAGALAPLEISNDLLVGGVSTASAQTKFAGLSGGENFMLGNLGIGTTDPASKLNIAGTGQATQTNISQVTANNALAITAAYGAGELYIPGLVWNMSDSNPTKANAGIYSRFGSGGSVLYFGISDSYATGITRDFSFGPGGYLATGLLTVPNISSAGNLDVSNNAVITGTLGVGATPANFKLEIAGSIGPSANNTYNLGSDTYRWASMYTNQLCLSGDCQTAWPAGSTSLWQETLGTLSPYSNSLDLLLGGTSTASAKFAFLNVNSGTPTASVSAGVAGGTFLTADGYLSTTARQNLTLGNSATYNTTGDILLQPNGTGSVGIGTTIPSAQLDITTNQSKAQWITQNVSGDATSIRIDQLSSVKSWGVYTNAESTSSDPSDFAIGGYFNALTYNGTSRSYGVAAYAEANGTAYGVQTLAQSSAGITYGIDAETYGAGIDNSYAGYFNNATTNATTDGLSKYGLYVTSTGNYPGSAGTATNNYGLYVATPTGADNNYAAIFAGGNVGIGTTAPGNRLAVISTTSPQFRIGYDNTTNFMTTGVSSAGAVTFDANGASAGFTFSDSVTANTFVSSGVTITGGTINGTSIGATTPSTGAFTTLSANSTVTLSGLAAGTDNSVLVLNASNQVVTDEIDPRVWGTGLVDGTSTAGYVTFWSDTDTISGESQLNVTRGGLGADMTAVGAGELIYSASTNTYDTLAAGTNDYILKSNGAAAPSWVDPSSLGLANYWSRVAGNLYPTLGESLSATTSGGTVGTFTATGTNLALRAGGTTNYLTVDANGNLSTPGTITSGLINGQTISSSANFTGTMAVASTLTASNGLTLTTGALSLTSTSGTLSLAGMSASSMNFGANNLTVTAGNFNTTATGINGTAIGATTPSTGAFTTLDANSTVTFTGLGTGTDNTVLILNASNQVTTDEIDGKVWNGALVDHNSTGLTNYVTYWADADTIAGEQFLNVTRGGLGADMTAAGAGELIYSTATNAYDSLAAGTSGYILQSNGASAPSWISQTTINYWQRNLGALAPLEVSNDLLVGGVSTASAKTKLAGLAGGENFMLGNLGIGTSNPATALDVFGEARSTRAEGTVALNAYNPDTPPDQGNLDSPSIRLTGVIDSHPSVSVVVREEHVADLVYVPGITGVQEQMQLLFDSVQHFAFSGEGTGRLGIGTTAPGQALDVVGNAVIGTNIGIGTTTVTSRINLPADTTAAGGINFGEDVALYRSAANILSLATGDDFNLVSGNVAVGNTNVITSGRLIQAANGGVGGPAFSFSADQNTGLYLAALETLGLVTNGAERLRVGDAGNVSIGTTTTADNRLAVISTTSQLRLGYDYATNFMSGTVSSAGLVTLDANGAGAGFSFSDNVGIGTTTVTSRINLPAATAAAGGINFGEDVALYRSAANILSLATGDDFNLVSGNVAVGSTNVITSGRLIQAANGGVGGTAYSFSADPDSGMYLSGLETLGLVTGGAERIRIDSAGNVAIGTTTASNRLAVISTASAQLRVGYDNTTNYATTSISSAGLVTEDANGAGAGFSFSDNVGIGTTTVTSRINLPADTTAAGGINFGGDVALYRSATNVLRLGDSDDLILGHASAGNVAIGTTTATQRLHVAGNIRLTGALYDSANSAGGANFILRTTGSATEWVDPATLGMISKWQLNLGSISPYSSTLDVLVGANATASARAKFSALSGGENFILGNLGIGTTDPAEALHIVGNVQLTQALMPNGNAGTSGYLLQSQGVNTAPIWVDPSAIAGTNFWQNNLNAMSPINNTWDILLGNEATASAGLRLTATTGQHSWFNNGGNFGIGTTNPAQGFELYRNTNAYTIARVSNPNTGNVAAAAFQVASNSEQGGFAATGSNFVYAHLANRVFVSSEIGNGLAFAANAGTGDIQLYTGGIAAVNERMRITSGGNFGIGTTTTTTALVNFPANTTATGGLAFGTDIALYRSAADTLRIGDSDNFVLADASTGNIAIGTTTTSNARMFAQTTTSAGTAIYGSVSSTGANTRGVYGLATGGTGATYGVWGESGSTSGTGVYGAANAGTGTTYGVYGSATSASGYAIYGSGRGYFSGSVGIGSLTPAQALDVVGNIRFSQAIMPNGNAGTSGYLLTSAGAGTAPTWSDPVAIVNQYSQWQLALGALAPNNITNDLLVGGNATASALVRLPGTNNQHAWVNLGTGNFGIGTTNPATFKLEVAGNIGPNADNTYDLGSDARRWQDLYLGPNTLHIGTSESDEGLISYNTTSNIFSFNTDSTQNGDIAFFTDDLYLDKSTGFVGIGTTAPTASLDVTGNASTSGTLSFRGTTDPTINVLNGEAFGISTSVGGDAGLTQRLTVLNDGTVGIGTTTPSSFLLQVAGNVGPNADATFDLGSASLRWRNLYISGMSTGGMTISSLFSSIVSAEFGDNGFTNFSGGIGTGGVDSLTRAIRLTSAGNLVNIGSYQGGSMTLTSGGTFAAAADYATALNPEGVVIGDVNGDGWADMAVTNVNADSVSVFINDGDGTFAAKADYGVGVDPVEIAIMDLNGDGAADLAVTNSSDDDMSILINDGDGTFAAKVDYPAGNQPYGIALGDLSGDGIPDAVVSNSLTDNDISVFINNGNGTFATKVDYATATGPFHVGIADVNGDGSADIAATNDGSTSVSIFINNGNGTFAAKADYTTGINPRELALADFNGDGAVDLAVANQGATDGLSILMNNGNGTYATKVDYSTVATGVYALAAGDVNGDGKPDVVTARNSANLAHVFLNSGTGTFAAGVTYSTGAVPRGVALGDLNGDGKADIAATNFNDSDVSVLLNQATPLFFANAATGNIGIGNNTPIARIHYTSGYSGFYYPNQAGMLLENNGSTNTWYTLQTLTAAGPGLSVMNSGNVGIGTATPSAQLDVQSDPGPQQRDAQPSGNDYALNVFGYQRPGLLVHSAGWAGGLNDDIARFSSIGSAYIEVPRLVIKGTGNVGIGTTAPAFKLEVIGDASASGSISAAKNSSLYVGGPTNAGVDGVRLHYATTTGSGYLDYKGASNMYFRADSTVGGTTRMTILGANGNVGIGTTVPADTLHVVGKVRATTGYHFFDTRTVNDQPQQRPGYAMTLDFKTLANVGSPPVAASATYAHVMTVAGWDTVGGSGGWPTQVSFGAGGIATRQATNATTWGAWTANSGDVSLAGQNYLTLSGQQITAGIVALTTHTSGNYVAGVTAGNGMVLTGTAGEGWTPSLAVGAGTGIVVNTDNVGIATTVARAAGALTASYVPRISSGNPLTLANGTIQDNGTNVGVGLAPYATARLLSYISSASGDATALRANIVKTAAPLATTGVAVTGRAEWDGASGTLAGLYGVHAEIRMMGTGGTITHGRGLQVEGQVDAANTITNLYMINVTNPTISGTVSNLRGLQINALTAGTNNYAIYVEGAGTGDKSYFGGNVGIGDATPAQKLEVAGRISMATWTADGDTAAYRDTATNSIALITSDRRLKKDIVNLEGALDVISQIQTYKYHDLDESSDAKLRLGFMAQELMPIMPELTYSFTKEGELETYYGVHYDKVTVLAIRAIKEQQTQIAALQASLNNSQLTLSDIGSVQIEGESDNYSVRPIGGGAALTQIIGVAQGVIGKLYAGLVSTKDLIVSGSGQIASLSVNSMTVAGQSLQAYIEGVVNNMQLAGTTSLPEGTLLVDNLIATGSAELSDVTADSLVLNNNASISGNLTVASDTTIQGILNTETVQTQSLQANSTLLGSLLVENDASVLGDASVSGNLDVQGSARITALESKLADIEHLSAVTASLYSATISGTLYAQTIDNLDGLIADSVQPTFLQQLLGYDPASTNSAQLLSQITGVNLSETLVLDPSALDELPVDATLLGAHAGFFSDYLQVNGNAAFGGDMLVVGNIRQTAGLSLGSNALSYLPTPLEECSPEQYTQLQAQLDAEQITQEEFDAQVSLCREHVTLRIQPTGSGIFNLMNGLLVAENGRITVDGEVTFKKSVTIESTLLTDLVAPTTFDRPFQLQVAGIATESGEVKKSRFELVDELGTPVATISAEGVGEFSKVKAQDGLSIGNEGDVTPANGQIEVSASAGRSTIQSGQSQITIVSNKITEDSLLNLTLLSDSNNQVLYIKSQTAGQAVVGFKDPVTTDTRFNWWIIE